VPDRRAQTPDRPFGSWPALLPLPDANEAILRTWAVPPQKGRRVLPPRPVPDPLPGGFFLSDPFVPVPALFVAVPGQRRVGPAGRPFRPDPRQPDGYELYWSDPGTPTTTTPPAVEAPPGSTVVVEAPVFDVDHDTLAAVRHLWLSSGDVTPGADVDHDTLSAVRALWLEDR
jgi:hypothetical protein